MKGYTDDGLDTMNQSQLIDTTDVKHNKCLQLLGLKAEILFSILRKRSVTILVLALCLTVFLCSLKHSIPAYKNIISSKLVAVAGSASSNVHQSRRTPTLAIVMVITPDLVNGSIARTSMANKQNYAKKHGYEFILDAAIDRSRSGPWARIVTIHSVMHARPDIEWFWCLDMDAFILEKQIDIYDQVTRKYQWGLNRKRNVTKDILMSNDCERKNSFNAGSFLIRNSQWSKSAMRTLYEKKYWDRHYDNEEQDAMFWLYQNDLDWRKKVQIFPMRLANSFPEPSCGERQRAQYRDGDMVVHYAGYRSSLPSIWPGELEKWRRKGKLIDDVEVDVLVK